MGRFVEGEDRLQSLLLPEILDDYVTEDNPVRVVEVFIEELDLGALGFEGVHPAATGRPAYHPSTLLKIYLYGYLNRIQSSRRLEREAQRNIELMWLTGRLSPDFKTIANFRRDNGPAIRAVCGQFIELCRRLHLFTKAIVAIDGSKFKAVNNRDKNFTLTKVAKRMEQVDASIARYLTTLDRADREESDIAEAKTRRIKDKIAGLRRQMQALKAMEQQVQDAPDKQVSLTDPDARSMATSGRGTGMVGYNVQTAVDAEHHLIVAHEVTNLGHDRTQLEPMALKALAATGCEELTALADRGYFNGEQVLACEGTGILPCIPKTVWTSEGGFFVPIRPRTRLIINGNSALPIQAAFVRGLVCRQFQGSRSANWLCGWLAMRASTSASHACGSISLSFAVPISVYMTAALSAPRSEPAKSQDFLPSARPRNARSAALFDRQIRPSRRKPVKAGQRLSI